MDVPSTLVIGVGAVGALCTLAMVVVLARRAPQR
ncbi:hypothetical protein F4693_000863 [Sphingomonas endophytica]|uniref:Uncharacterized protein n=1 Tax=Sphingomonas endophytica TaxID=869719 RepID=A0A7X0JA83_9SPHN|nr:hypothetical protein [Sphingomonas endophytica]